MIANALAVIWGTLYMPVLFCVGWVQSYFPDKKKDDEKTKGSEPSRTTDAQSTNPHADGERPAPWK